MVGVMKFSKSLNMSSIGTGHDCKKSKNDEKSIWKGLIPISPVFVELAPYLGS